MIFAEEQGTVGGCFKSSGMLPSSYREQHPGESPVLGFATTEPPTW